MNHSEVLIKTAKGKEEVRTKAFNLSPNLRRLLYLVDGRSTVAATLSRLAILGEDAESALGILLAEGYVAPRPTISDPSARQLNDDPTTEEPLTDQTEWAKSGASALPPRFNLDKAKGFARFIVLGYLGTVGAHRVERIDAARSAAELRAELLDLRDALPKLLQKHQAKHAWDQLEPLMLSATHAQAGTPVWHQGPKRRQDTVRIGGAANTAFPPRAWERKAGIVPNPSQSGFSETILEFARPLTDAAIGTEAEKRAVQMAVICWNAAILPGNKGLETIAPTLREIAGEDRKLEQELFDIFEIMRARKHTHFSSDDRFVVDFVFTDTPEGLCLSVVSEPMSRGQAGVASSGD